MLTSKQTYFLSEADLEDFIWTNLNDLLGLEPIARQHCMDNRRIDILAKSSEDSIVIIELKNVEDRNIIRQLSFYHDKVVNLKPFSEEINYDKPVILIGIAPSFESDTLLEVKYSTLDFLLYKFQLRTNSSSTKDYSFDLLGFNNDWEHSISIKRNWIEQVNDNVSEIPPRLLKISSELSSKARENLLDIRLSILGYDSRMSERIQSGAVNYGIGKKICASFELDRKKGPVLFLWIPRDSNKRTKKKLSMKIKLFIDWEKPIVTNMSYYYPGQGRPSVISAMQPKSRHNSRGLWQRPIEPFLKDALKFLIDRVGP